MTGGERDIFEVEPDPEGDGEGTPSPFFVAVDAATVALGGRSRLGRPAGATNRKSKSFEKWFFAMGFKDPAVYLAELYSADPMALRAAIGGETTLKEVVDLQVKAAGELMPYLHGKKPTDLSDVPDEQLPHLFIMAGTDQLEQGNVILETRKRAQAALSAGTLIEVSENKDLAGSDGDRHTDDRHTDGESEGGTGA